MRYTATGGLATTQKTLRFETAKPHWLQEAYGYYRPRYDYLSQAIRCVREFFKDRIRSYLLRSGVDLSTIANWLGHASTNTTGKYLAADLEAKREALAKAKPILNGRRPLSKWRTDRNLIRWLENL